MSGIELVTVGTELLLGETIDGNGAWLGSRLARLGIRVRRKTSVPDDAREIRDAVGAALERSGAVICTGGLGPTEDDLTRWAVAELFHAELSEDPEVLESIRSRFRQRGLDMPDRNRRQALVPVGARVLPNRHGTAPGLVLEGEPGVVALLPGVPHEMRALFDDAVAPLFAERAGPALPIAHRLIRTTGIAESALAERLEGIEDEVQPLTLAFLPELTGVDLRITCWDRSADEAGALLDRAEAAVRRRIGPDIYGRDDSDLVVVVGELLKERGHRLAVAESCTGGLLGERLTAPAGASGWFIGGIIAYTNDMKLRALDVDAETLAAYGAVSEQVAREMVLGAQRRTIATAALSITGIAGPDGGSEEKPVGTVWIGAAVADDVQVRQFRFGADRHEVRIRSTQAALTMLWHMLREDEG